jgi:hypothetical protein
VPAPERALPRRAHARGWCERFIFVNRGRLVAGALAGANWRSNEAFRTYLGRLTECLAAMPSVPLLTSELNDFLARGARKARLSRRGRPRALREGRDRVGGRAATTRDVDLVPGGWRLGRFSGTCCAAARGFAVPTRCSQRLDISPIDALCRPLPLRDTR